MAANRFSLSGKRSNLEPDDSHAFAMTPPPQNPVPGAPPSPWFTPLGVGLTVGAITIVRLAYLTVYPFDLHPDEAQYWSWSLSPDWGYYSKPPMVAWLIAAFTALCGSGEACIKASAPILHGIAACFCYGAGARLYGPRAGFFAALLYLTLPGVSFSSSIMSTDPPLLACWAAAFYAAVRLGDGAAPAAPWWLALGLATGLGLLSKYAMGFFILGFVLWLALDGAARRRLMGAAKGRAGLLLAGAMAFLLILPNLIWNMGTGFVTFAHTAANANLGGALLRPEKFVEFTASQFGVFGPIVFAVLAWLLLRPDRWLREPRARMLAAFVLAALLPIMVLSLVSRAHANWAATAYLAGSVWVAGVMSGPKGRWWLNGSIALHVAVAATLMAASIGQAEPGRYAGLAVPQGLDPYKHYGGWRALGEKVAALKARFPGVPLVGHDRMMVASALYYVRPWPVEIFAWHPGGRVTDHFRLTRPWPGPVGGDALLLSRRGDPTEILARFRTWRLVETMVVPISTGARRSVQVFHARGFLGYKRD